MPTIKSRGKRKNREFYPHLHRWPMRICSFKSSNITIILPLVRLSGFEPEHTDFKSNIFAVSASYIRGTLVRRSTVKLQPCNTARICYLYYNYNAFIAVSVPKFPLRTL